MSKLRPSTRKLIEVVEELVYSDEYDPSIRCAMKASNAWEDLLKYGNIKNAITYVLEVLEKEKVATLSAHDEAQPPKPAASAPSPTDGLL